MARPAFWRVGRSEEAHVARVEREYLHEALEQTQGVKMKAAERLGLTFRQFRYLLKKYGVKDE